MIWSDPILYYEELKKMGAPSKEVDLQAEFELRYNALRPWHKHCRWYGLAAIVAMMFIVAMFVSRISTTHAYPQPMLGICIAIIVIFGPMHIYTTRILWRIISTKLELLNAALAPKDISDISVRNNPVDSMEIEFGYDRTPYKYICNTKMFPRGYTEAMRLGDWYDWRPTFPQAIESAYQ